MPNIMMRASTFKTGTKRIPGGFVGYASAIVYDKSGTDHCIFRIESTTKFEKRYDAVKWGRVILQELVGHSVPARIARVVQAVTVDNLCEGV